MSKTNIKIILILLSLLMLGGVYMYVYQPNEDDTETLESETQTLETRLAELKEKEKDRDMYLQETEAYYDKFDAIADEFPAALNQEVSIMFMKGIEDTMNQEFQISTAGLGRANQFYTLGGTAEAPDGYACYQASFPLSYAGTYDKVKDVIDYVMNFQYRMNIDSISIAYDAETEILTGSISLNAYCITGGDREPETVDVDVNNGVDNLFIGGADSPSTQTYSYDTDNGAAIVDDNDIKLVLNDANNDAAAGIVVSAGGSGTNVTSSENSVQTVALHIYEEDGKNYATYAIGDEEYTTEITSSNVKIYVASSERVNADDKNGVKLNISNDTNLVVFVKVTDDDTSSPRFALGSKTGTVKVY